ncbi:isocitrate lyase/PEP mutase family protein [Salinarimonas ramus]|uniref:2-methylisocitrate lyase n=1 Tax=Salinarimonas ramus TaxID=690164 RepID=A0A917V5G4_9HYPH|nr:isocitrate lyase/phosphoenolpyruvate mutase family protein [Salinarimonas ramus]GGK39408.1 2-methylisocitrate lyase [Salinarimonas ramus]
MSHDPGPAFRALHRPGDPFVLANAWDLGSARMLAALGAQALGTSSAAYAFTLGRPDMGHVTRDEMLAHAQDLVAATPLPVSADLENGYGDAPDAVAETVRLACDAGLAGLSIEDVMPPAGAAYPFDLAVERIRAGAAAARACPRDIVLLARADGVMTGAYDLDEGIRRLQAFVTAGADAVYLPAPASMEDVARICASVEVPVNALAAGRFTDHRRADFAAAGVARISLGSALARATHRLIKDAAEAMLGDAGDFSLLSRSISGEAVDALLAKGTR